MIDIHGSWTLNLGGAFGFLFGCCPLIVLGGLILVLLTRSRNGAAAAEQKDDQFETALQQTISRLKSSSSASRWTPPKLPYSVMAGVWIHRLIDENAQSVYGSSRDPLWSLRTFNWGYRREAPYIISAALLSLRDSGLITISAEPNPGALRSLNAVQVERTDLAVTLADLPVIEGGLLMACEDLGHKRFFKTATPGIHQLVLQFRSSGGHPSNAFRWVSELAANQACSLGLCEPGSDHKRGKKVYALEHLAACDDQVVAFTARWREFVINEPETQQRLVTEAAFALRSGGGG